MAMLYHRLYGALSAAEALNVCDQGPPLNARGVRLLRYLQSRRGRAYAAEAVAELPARR